MNKAVCALIRKNGLILAVSRKNDPNDFGLPGGKVDPGETPGEAVVREVLEETGLILKNPVEVFSTVCGPGKDGKSYLTTTYSGIVEGRISSEEAGVVSWVSPRTLVQGSFGDYNRSLFQKVGITWEE